MNRALGRMGMVMGWWLTSWCRPPSQRPSLGKKQVLDDRFDRKVLQLPTLIVMAKRMFSTVNIGMKLLIGRPTRCSLQETSKMDCIITVDPSPVGPKI